MLTDALEITTRLFNNDAPVSYKGTHFSLDGAVLLPRPQRAGGPPIMIGGNGPTRTLPLAAEFADEWNAVYLDPATYAERNRLLDELLDKAQRAPGDVKRSVMTNLRFATDDADLERIKAGRTLDETRSGGKTFVGTASMLIDQIGAYVDAGAERIMLQWLDMDDLDRLDAVARDVLPHFHKD